MSVEVDRPTQAVILAGGRGSRLAPLTDRIPKPMIEFHRKPFLEYLVEMLRQQGFCNILLLLGYLPQVIKGYFGDGSRLDVKIKYSVSDPNDDSGRRLKLAQPMTDPTFLLMYCDNYWPMRFDEMWRQFVSADVPAQITVYQNSDGYTRDNVRVDRQGYVLAYDKSRLAPNMRGVEIGFVILKREVLDLLPYENVSFEKLIYPKLVERRQLRAYVTGHRYYSVGSHERLGLTTDFLARRPAVILDRDGVLNRKLPPATYVRSWTDWEWVPGAKDALRVFREAGYRVIIVTNQAGVGRRAMTEDDLKKIHERMKAESVAAGGYIDAVYYCPHDWDQGCDCRKPRPGMLLQAQRDFSLDLSRSYFIGDDERDGEAAVAAGCPWLLVSEEKSLLDCARFLVSDQEAGRNRSAVTSVV